MKNRYMSDVGCVFENAMCMGDRPVCPVSITSAVTMTAMRHCGHGLTQEPHATIFRNKNSARTIRTSNTLTNGWLMCGHMRAKLRELGMDGGGPHEMNNVQMMIAQFGEKKPVNWRAEMLQRNHFVQVMCDFQPKCYNFLLQR